jgi:hypothetical protein
VSRRAHNIVRLFLSGFAALFAYTVVITSRPAAVAASERAGAPKRPATDVARTDFLPAVRPLPDPRQRLLHFPH